MGDWNAQSPLWWKSDDVAVVQQGRAILLHEWKDATGSTRIEVGLQLARVLRKLAHLTTDERHLRAALSVCRTLSLLGYERGRYEIALTYSHMKPESGVDAVDAQIANALLSAWIESPNEVRHSGALISQMGPNNIRTGWAQKVMHHEAMLYLRTLQSELPSASEQFVVMEWLFAEHAYVQYIADRREESASVCLQALKHIIRFPQTSPAMLAAASAIPLAIQLECTSLRDQARQLYSAAERRMLAEIRKRSSGSPAPLPEEWGLPAAWRALFGNRDGASDGIALLRDLLQFEFGRPSMRRTVRIQLNEYLLTRFLSEGNVDDLIEAIGICTQMIGSVDVEDEMRDALYLQLCVLLHGVGPELRSLVPRPERARAIEAVISKARPDYDDGQTMLAIAIDALLNEATHGDGAALDVATSLLEDWISSSPEHPSDDSIRRIEWTVRKARGRDVDLERLDEMSDAISTSFRFAPEVAWRRLRRTHGIVDESLVDALLSDFRHAAERIRSISSLLGYVAKSDSYASREIFDGLRSRLQMDDLLTLEGTMLTQHWEDLNISWRRQICEHLQLHSPIPVGEGGVEACIRAGALWSADATRWADEIRRLVIPTNEADDRKVADQFLLAELLLHSTCDSDSRLRARLAYQRVAGSKESSVATRAIAARRLQLLHGGLWPYVVSAYLLLQDVYDRRKWQAAGGRPNVSTLATLQGLAARAAYASTMAVDPLNALEFIEQGQALQAQAAVSQSGSNPDLIRINFPVAYQKWWDAAQRLHDAVGGTFSRPSDQFVVSVETDPPTRRMSRDEFVRHQAALRPDLAGLLADEQSTSDELAALCGPMLLPASASALIAHCSKVGAKMVHLISTEWGGSAVILDQFGGVSVVDLKELSGDRVRCWIDSINGGLDSIMDLNDAPRGLALEPDPDALESTITELAVALSPLSARLMDSPPQPILLTLSGSLGALPVTAALHMAASPDAPLDVRVAPSGRIHITAHTNRKLATGTGIAAVTDALPRIVDGHLLPSLPGAHAEGVYLEEAYGATHWSRADANAASVLGVLGSDWRAIHLAVHGRANLETPELSELFLSEAGDGSGVLCAAEIAHRKIRARLVYLACCWAGRPGLRLPDEAIGFPTSMIQAGACAVIAPLWPISDKVANYFARTFYSTWMDGGLSIGDSFAAAMRATRSEYNHSLTWAAFVLYGDGG